MVRLPESWTIARHGLYNMLKIRWGYAARIFTNQTRRTTTFEIMNKVHWKVNRVFEKLFFGY